MAPEPRETGGLGKWWSAKVSGPFYEYLKEGASDANRLGRSAALGFSIGLCPLFGISTAATLLVIVVVRQCRPTLLHGPMALLANLISLPFELLVLIPYLRLGELLTGSPHLKLSPVSLEDLIRHRPLQAVDAIMHAMLGWAVSFPLQVCVLALLLTPPIACIQKRVRGRTHSHAENGSETEDLLGPQLRRGDSRGRTRSREDTDQGLDKA